MSVWYRDAKCKEELEGWNLAFENNLVRYSARVVPPEAIFQRTAKVSCVISYGRLGGERCGSHSVKVFFFLSEQIHFLQ